MIRFVPEAFDQHEMMSSLHLTRSVTEKAVTTLSSLILPLLNHKMKKKHGLTIKTLNKSIEFVSVIAVKETKQLILLLVSIN